MKIQEGYLKMRMNTQASLQRYKGKAWDTTVNLNAEWERGAEPLSLEIASVCRWIEICDEQMTPLLPNLTLI